MPIAGLGRRVVMVGDPGQIAPLTRGAIDRWQSNPAGPHVACPKALIHRHPGVMRVRLPVSRRLPSDTVEVLQPAFYPNLPFNALSPSGERRITANPGRDRPDDLLIDTLLEGSTLARASLEARHTGERDDELAAIIARVAMRLLEREAVVHEGDRATRLTPSMMGVVCAHISQVSAVGACLPATMREVHVETANRYQGLERAITLVHHPLSGRSDLGPFQLEAGRLCVMVSRHRHACIVFGREGMRETLEAQRPSGPRILGHLDDADHVGWSAHRSLLKDLSRRGCARL